MKYNIDSVIKRLERARKAGVGMVEEAELIRIATPQVNNIDSTIRYIERMIKKRTKEERTKDGTHVLYREVDGVIPRKTLYRWEKEGIIIPIRHMEDNNTIRSFKWFDLRQLKDTLNEIKNRMTHVNGCLSTK
jgi:hypothetical protein